jgi:hypothetical protein
MDRFADLDNIGRDDPREKGKLVSLARDRDTPLLYRDYISRLMVYEEISVISRYLRAS